MADDNTADMYISDAERCMTALDAVGADLRAAWSTASEQMDTVSQLGLGPMGQKFAANYGPGHRRLHTDGPKVVAEGDRLVETGKQGVTIYDQSSRESTAALGG